MKRMSCRVVTCLALLLSCLFMISSCDARSIAIQQVTDQRQSSDREPQQYQVTVSEGSDQLKIVVDEPQSSYAQETSLASGITRTLRNEIPSSYLLEIKGFSELNSTKPPSYESAAFDAAGFKWRLNFFPNGNNQKGYISLYARIEDLLNNSVVNVDLKLFVYNQHQKKYLTIQDGNIKHFDETNKEWGFGQLLSLSTFLNSSNGYLVNDTCLLGAEIFVIKPAEFTETLSWILKPELFNFTLNLSETTNHSVPSPDFQFADRIWRLDFWPLGIGAFNGKGSSVRLFSSGFVSHSVEVKTYACAAVRLRDVDFPDHIHEKPIGGWYPIGPGGYTIEDYITLAELAEFINEGLIHVEVEFKIVSVTKVVPNNKTLGPVEAVPIFM